MEQVTSSESIQVVSFSIITTGKKEDYAIPIEQVREIRPIEKITKVPRSEPYVKGIMNLRGVIIPVIDVKEKLGVGSQVNSAKQRILVAEVNGNLAGLLVDEVDQVMRIQTTQIEQAPQGALESYHYIKGVVKVNERLVIIIDVQSLLNNSEQKLGNISKSKEQTQPQKDITRIMESNGQIDDIPAELAEVFKEDEQGITLPKI